MRLRIALVVPGFSVHSEDWAIPALLNLARGLTKDHNVHIFSQRYPARGTYQFDGLIHHAIGSEQKFGLASARTWLQTSQAIIAQHRRTPFDLLHAFWADEAGFSAVLAGMIINRPVVVSIGGGELTNLPHVQYGAQRFLARRLTTRLTLAKASILSAGSAYQLDLCRQHHVSQNKLHLAPLGVDIDHFRPHHRKNLQSPNLPTSQSSPSIIQVASLVPVKNQQLMLKVVQCVKNQMPNIHVNVMGTGPLQHELTKLAQKLDLVQNITWHGHIPYPQLPQLIQQSHLYLQTSHHESQGMAVLEAMACGLPVLGTPVGVVKAVAFRPATTSCEMLANQIVEYFINAATSQHGQEAREVVKQKYSLKMSIDTFSNLYKNTVTT